MSKEYPVGEELPAADLNEIVRTTGLYAVDAGGDDTYAITVTPAPDNYSDGDEYTFKVATGNTGACTLNVNGLGAIAIKKYSQGGKIDLATGDILANQMVRVKYDTTDDYFVLQAGTPQVILQGVDTATALDYSSPTVTTITHSLGVIPRYIEIITITTAIGGNNSPSISHGFAIINAADGTVVSQMSDLIAMGDGSPYYGNSTSYVAQLSAKSGGNGNGLLSGVSSTQMVITFGATGFGTYTPIGRTTKFHWKVWA